MSMIAGFPDSPDFEPGQLRDADARWSFHRDANTSGKNVGQDFMVPEGSVIVDFETHETSRFNTKGEPDIRLVFEDRGPVRIPNGVHVGIRLTPDDYPGGAGAGFTGDIKMKVVSEADWFTEFLNGDPH
ncbi:hypothetical protein [Paenibacillus polymyxa]|uniref:hypothetical protein n=1 Tax=Paenibacillus polymyxa TaxID=1406 RepID=UPI0007EB0FD9|nr:hypothetical protein [Paenibacillus polymyxa]OAZ43355.1 hypothetical protein A9Z39_22200 [Paenibacillus polymyxa]